MENDEILARLRGNQPVRRVTLVLDRDEVLNALRERVRWCRETIEGLRRTERPVPAWARQPIR